MRAYVCGAPAAAIAMCRAAEKRFEFLRTLKLAELKETGDEILHRYHRRQPLGASDEKVIIDYMQSLKTLIQNVER